MFHKSLFIVFPSVLQAASSAFAAQPPWPTLPHASHGFRHRFRVYTMADADDHEKDVEELDERMQKLTHKLENARRDMVRRRVELSAVEICM